MLEMVCYLGKQTGGEGRSGAAVNVMQAQSCSSVRVFPRKTEQRSFESDVVCTMGTITTSNVFLNPKQRGLQIFSRSPYFGLKALNSPDDPEKVFFPVQKKERKEQMHSHIVGIFLRSLATERHYTPTALPIPGALFSQGWMTQGLWDSRMKKPDVKCRAAFHGSFDDERGQRENILNH